MKRLHRGVPLLGFVAASGTGKTTLIKAVIPLLAADGLRIGCVKHTHHPFEIDYPGKDSYALRKAGAEQMLLGSGERWALIVEPRARAETTLEDMLDRLVLETLDLVLIEGFKLEAIPKIEIQRRGVSGAPRCASDRSIVALATDCAPAAPPGVPLLDLNQPEQVARFIADYVTTSARLHRRSTDA